MGLYDDFKNKAKRTINGVYNDAKKTIKEKYNYRYDEADRYVRRLAYKYFPIKNPYEGTVYDINESENSANGLPDYAGYGIRKEPAKDSTAGADDYRSAVEVMDLPDDRVKNPLKYNPPDNSMGSYLKWGIGGGLAGTAAAAAYTNFMDDEFERLPHPRLRTRRLARNLLIGAGTGAGLSLLTKYMLGR